MKKNVDLLNSSIDSSLRAFAIPLALSFLINMLYAWVDLYYVSFLGGPAVAALGISERIWFFVFSIGSGFSVGSGIIIARRFGEGKLTEANRISTQSVSIILLIGTIISIGLYFSMDFILHLLGMKDDVANLSKTYFTALAFGIPFHFAIFHFNMILRSVGNSFYPMLIMIIGNVLNIIIAPMFIFGFLFIPRYEIMGAGIGTAISQFLGAGIGLLIIKYGNTPLKLDFKDFKIDPEIFKNIFRLGFPASLQLVAVSSTSMGLAANANLFGTTVLTAFVLGLRIDLFMSMTIIAFGAAMEIVSAQNLGAGNIPRIFQYYRSGVKQLSIFMAIMGVVIFFFGKNIVVLFTNNHQVLEIVDSYLKVASFGYIPFAIGMLSIRTISGGGDYFRSLIITAVVLIFWQLPLAFSISHFLNSQNGIWYAQLISMVTFAIVGYWQLSQKKWLNRKF